MGFSERFPRWITALIAIGQLAVTAAIVALEVLSIFVDLAHGTIYAGFWCGLIFIATFMMMFFITCCCRGRCCSTYVLILNIISGCLACVLIYFNQYFMNNLCKCYLGDQLCCAIRSISSFNSNYGSIAQNCTTALAQGTSALSIYTCPVYPSSKLIYIQAQLGCAAGMLGICALYVVVYLFACFGVCFGDKNAVQKFA